MKKVISISIITCLLFFSCETSKQEVKNSDNSQVELSESSTDADEETESEETEIETIAREEDAIDNTTLESENNINETAFEEKINDNPYEYTEELISENEIAEDFSESKNNSETQSSEKTNNETSKADTPEKTNPVVQKTASTDKTPSSIDKTNATTSKPAANSNQNTTTKQAGASKPDSTASKNAASNTVETNNEPKTLQQELSEASDQIKPEDETPVPSRSMQIKNRQFIDVAYPGTGWVYLGEVEKQNLFVFFGRKIENGETIFTLQPKKSGNATLHFYKNDPVSQKYIDDYMSVSVSTESATDNTHEKAPLYASVVPPKPEKPVVKVAADNKESENQADTLNITSSINPKKNKAASQTENDSDPSNIQTRISKSNSSGETVPDFTDSPAADTKETVVSSADLLDAAQKAYNEKKYAEALQLVRDFFLTTSSRIDEGLFLEAQILEAKSPVQNIKGSIADYDTIVNKWPASRLWKKANERSIYLKRFYIDIR